MLTNISADRIFSVFRARQYVSDRDNTQQTTWRHIQKYCILNTYCCENLRSHTGISVVEFSRVMIAVVFGVLVKFTLGQTMKA